jgi:DNA-binding response OmpR family regulator
MRILIAEDEAVSQRLLEHTLSRWGYQTTSVADGTAAWEILSGSEPPQLAILDWMMPGLTGVEVCRLQRAAEGRPPTYLILVTARDDTADVVQGLEAGANDYVTKPYQDEELRARIEVGARMIQLESDLALRVQELQAALAEVKQLQGIIPICCYCKKVRSDDRFWQRVEDYIKARTAADFSHGICPECWESVVQPQMVELWGHTVPYEES